MRIAFAALILVGSFLIAPVATVFGQEVLSNDSIAGATSGKVYDFGVD